MSPCLQRIALSPDDKERLCASGLVQWPPPKPNRPAFIRLSAKGELFAENPKLSAAVSYYHENPVKGRMAEAARKFGVRFNSLQRRILNQRNKAA